MDVFDYQLAKDKARQGGDQVHLHYRPERFAAAQIGDDISAALSLQMSLEETLYSTGGINRRQCFPRPATDRKLVRHFAAAYDPYSGFVTGAWRQ